MNIVEPNEFFQNMFSGDPIPTRKIDRIIESKR